MKTIEFQVVGDLRIDCAACEQRFDRALRRIPGVQAVQASSQDQHVAVTVQPEMVSAEQAQARLEEMGYQILPQEGDQ